MCERFLVGQILSLGVVAGGLARKSGYFIGRRGRSDHLLRFNLGFGLRSDTEFGFALRLGLGFLAQVSVGIECWLCGMGREPRGVFFRSGSRSRLIGRCRLGLELSRQARCRLGMHQRRRQGPAVGEALLGIGRWGRCRRSGCRQGDRRHCVRCRAMPRRIRWLARRQRRLWLWL